MGTAAVDSHGRVVNGQDQVVRHHGGDDRTSTNGHGAHRSDGAAGGDPSSRERGSPGSGSRGPSRHGSSRLLTSRQKRRMRRTQESARELRELQSQHHSVIPVQVRQPDYWRDLSIEIVGTIFSAMLIFSVGHVFGYIEHPSGRSELPRLIGLLATLFTLIFAFLRTRRVRKDHPGASSARLAQVYLRAIKPHWSLPTLALGVLLGLGYL
jgi:hypothetical protein